ncbi:hypothetical protein A3709_10740 [Halioglobus sp. HI00S01]|nr:hypothetical protein A3709_10740 [Halioglobus sp. HI00S01]
MAGILISLVWVEYSDGHPGWITLLPVFGTVLFIGFASPANALVRLLSARFFVGVGLISYALYLWHYPIFAFGRMFTWHPGLSEKALWIVLTVGLALSSYWLVEKPLRNRRRVSWRTYFAVTGGAHGVILLANGAWILGGGYPDRADYVHRLIKDSQHVDLMQDGRRCHSGGLNQPYFNVDDSCEFTHFPDASYLMLVGDSHAGNLAHSAYRLARESGLNFIQVTQAGCSHLLYQTQGGLCRSRAKRLRQLLKKHPNSTIVYSARLPLYLEMVGFDGGEGFCEAGYPAAWAEEVAEHQPVVRQSILSTVQGWLDSGHNVVLVYPVPEQGFHASYMLAHQRPPILEEADLPLLSTSMAVFKARTASSYAALDELQGQNLSRVYPEKLFCREATGRYLVTEGERLYFLVDNHVARLGAEMIMSEVSKVLGLEVPPEGRL